MLTLTRAVKTLGVAMCIGMAAPVFAESAPVYDADSMQQDMGEESAPDQGQYLPPPPSIQESEGGFVPMQSSPSPAVVMSEQPPAASLSVEQRVRRVEQQVNNMQTNDAATRIESLQSQVQTLRGQVEQLTHQLEQLQTAQKDMYSDLDKRLAQANSSVSKSLSRPETVTADVSSGAGSAAVAAVAAASTVSAKSTSGKQSSKSSTSVTATNPSQKSMDNQPNVAEEQQIYQTAYNMIKAKKYNEAVSALQGMLKKYPSGQFASNAHYWLGELYGLMGKSDQALTEFTVVVKTYPDSPRVSDAQLKVGLILASQLKWPDAKSTFKQIINHYPGSASARLAAEQLKQIKQAGH